MKQSNGEIKQVAFKSGMFGKRVDFDFHQIWGDDEIVGNTYENPELLKPNGHGAQKTREC